MQLALLQKKRVFLGDDSVIRCVLHFVVASLNWVDHTHHMSMPLQVRLDESEFREIREVVRHHQMTVAEMHYAQP